MLAPSSFADDAGLRPFRKGSALSMAHHPFPVGDSFRGSIGSLSLRPVELLASLTDLTGSSEGGFPLSFTLLGGSPSSVAQPTETFTPELSTSRSPFSPSGITTVVSERFHRWDSHPLERQLASLHGLFQPLQHDFITVSAPRPE